MGTLLGGALLESTADGGGLLEAETDVSVGCVKFSCWLPQWLLLWLVDLLDGWLAFLLNG